MINNDLLLDEEEFDEETSTSHDVTAQQVTSHQITGVTQVTPLSVASHPAVTAIVEEVTQVLRHRRNNSKDLNVEPSSDLIKIDNETATTDNKM